MRALRGPHRRNLAGFTLIEVLLALAIVSFLMVTITQILTVARNSRDVIHNIQEKQLAGPAILSRIESDLRGLFVFARDRRGTLRIRNGVEAGFDADTIDFVATTDSLLPFSPDTRSDFQRADLTEVGYRLRQHPSSDDFLEMYRREGFGVDEEPFDGGRYALLHDRIKGFNIEVYAENGPEAEPLESWGSGDDEFSGLPAWIVIDLTLELAPRLVREQLVVDRRTITYRRIVHFPSSLALALETQPLPKVPVLETPVAASLEGGPAGGAEGEEGEGDELVDPDAEGEGAPPDFPSLGDDRGSQSPFGGG